MILGNPRVYSNQIQVLLQKDLALCIYLLKKKKKGCYQLLFIVIIFEPRSSSSEVLDYVYCPQPAELLCDSSNSASTGMPELEGKEFEYPDARLFLAITHFGPDGILRLCPLYSGLEPADSSSVWRKAGMGIHLGTPRGIPVDKDRVGWVDYLFQTTSIR